MATLSVRGALVDSCPRWVAGTAGPKENRPPPGRERAGKQRMLSSSLRVRNSLQGG